MREEKPQPSRVSRSIGKCDRCEVEPANLIKSYDPRIYKGEVCAKCLIEGKASIVFPPHHEVMKPMVYLALAYEGREPYRSYIERGQMKGETLALTIAKIDDRIAEIRASRPKQNRHERRRAKVLSRKLRT